MPMHNEAVKNFIKSYDRSLPIGAMRNFSTQELLGEASSLNFLAQNESQCSSLSDTSDHGVNLYQSRLMDPINVSRFAIRKFRPVLMEKPE